MSLSARDQQALDGIEDGLARSAPKLAAMLATFTRLTSDEEMPADEGAAGIRRDAHDMRRRFRRAGLRRTAPLLWLLIALAVMTIVVAVSHGGGGVGCFKSLPVACGSSVPTHPARPAPKTAGHRAPPAVARPGPAAG